MVNLDIDRNSLIYIIELLEGVIGGKIKYNKGLFSVTVKYKDLTNTLKELKRRLKND